MPSTDRKLELTAKASMAQPVSQTAVCSNGLTKSFYSKKKKLSQSSDKISSHCKLFD